MMREPTNLWPWLCLLLVMAGTIPALFIPSMWLNATGNTGIGAMFASLIAYVFMLCTHLLGIAILVFALVKRKVRTRAFAKAVAWGAAAILVSPIGVLWLVDPELFRSLLR